MAGCSGAPGDSNGSNENVVNVYNWADYIAPDTIEKFEAETGIRVNYDIYDSTYIVDTKLLAGRSGYDVVIHAGQNTARLIPIDIFEVLDPERLSHWDEQDQKVLKLAEVYPRTREFSAIYMWGTTGVAYNAEMVRARLPDAPVESADMLFDPDVVAKLSDCGVTLLDEADDVFPIALAYLGLDPNSTVPEDMLAVEEMLARVRPYYRYFSSTKMISDLPNKEVCVAMSWSGDYAQAAARAEEVGIDIDLRYSVPAEGSRLWFDGMYIPADAQHKDNAYRFIDFIMRPDIIADISNYVFYANGIESSKPLVLPRVVNDPGIYPTEQIIQRLFVAKILSPKEERQRNRAWARIKSGI